MPVALFYHPSPSPKNYIGMRPCHISRNLNKAKQWITSHVCGSPGKLKEIKGGFTFLGWGTVIARTGIVFGGNSSKLKALQKNLASFEMMTEWVDAPDVPPPHAFITAF